MGAQVVGVGGTGRKWSPVVPTAIVHERPDGTCSQRGAYSQSGPGRPRRICDESECGRPLSVFRCKLWLPSRDSKSQPSAGGWWKHRSAVWQVRRDRNQRQLIEAPARCVRRNRRAPRPRAQADQLQVQRLVRAPWKIRLPDLSRNIRAAALFPASAESRCTGRVKANRRVPAGPRGLKRASAGCWPACGCWAEPPNVPPLWNN